MCMRAAGGLVRKRFGHKSGVVAKLVRDVLNAVFEGETKVAGAQGFMRTVVDLELSGSVFGIGGNNVDADVWHEFDYALDHGYGGIAHGIEDVQAVEDRLHAAWI